MERVLTVAFALFLIPNPASSSKREYHWKSGTLTVLKEEDHHLTMTQQSDQAITPMQVVQQTWTYQVDGDEGTYVVKIEPEPLTAASGRAIQYDIDRKTMHVNMAVDGKRPKITNLQILKFTPKQPNTPGTARPPK